jgi:hypothetical protein
MNPVIFLHVPKACGTTLIKLLHRWHPREEVYEVGTKSRAEHMTELRARPDVRLVMGHAAFGLHEALAAPARYITVLREPVARAISHFHYAGRTPGHPLHERIRNGEMNLFAVARHVANLQTRYLSGRLKGVPDERTLELAKENVVRHFAVAGLTERFNETVVLLHRIFARKLRPFASENVGPRHSSIDALSPDELRELHAQHELDYALYEFVRARFDEQIAQQDDTFARQVARLQVGNRIADLAVRTMRRVRPKGQK